MVGVSFLGQTVYFAQQIYDSGTAIVEMLGRLSLPSEPDVNTLQDPGFRHELSDLFEQIKNELHFPDRQIGIAIPHEWIHFYITQVDSHLDAGVKREYADWEVRQRLGDHADIVKTLYYPISGGNTLDSILTVTLPKELVNMLKSATDKVHFEVNRLDIDTFAAWRNVLDESGGKKYLIRFAGDVVNLSEMKDNVLYGAALYKANYEQKNAEFIKGTYAEKQRDELSQFIRALIAGEAESGTAVWIYGTGIPESVKSQVESLSDYQYVFSFQGLKTNFRDSDDPDVINELPYGEVAGIIRQAIRAD